MRQVAMAEEFYHDITIGFNYWYLVLLIALALTAALGACRFYVSEDGKIRKRGRKFRIVLRITKWLLSFMVVSMIVIESFWGALQFFANILAQNDGIEWALMLVTVTFGALPFILFSLMTAAAHFGEMYSLGRIVQARHQKRRRKFDTDDDDDSVLDDQDDDTDISKLTEKIGDKTEELLFAESVISIEPYIKSEEILAAEQIEKIPSAPAL